MDAIKKINVKIKRDDTTTFVDEFDLGSKAENVDFSAKATDPFANQLLENSVPNALANAANSVIYAKPYIRNNDPNKIVDYINNQHGNDTVLESTTMYKDLSSGGFSISYGQGSLATGYNSQAFGFDCLANGWASHAEGKSTVAGSDLTAAQGFAANYAHAEGGGTRAIHDMAHAEGDGTKASGYASHTEGDGTKVFSLYGHAEGVGNTVGDEQKIIHDGTNIVYGNDTTNDIKLEKDAETWKSYINGQGSHAEGRDNTIFGAYCHAHGVHNTINKVYGATAIGEDNTIDANRGVTLGFNNKVQSENAVALGSYNTIPAGHSDCVMIGTHAGLGENESTSCVLAVGGGDKDNYANLMTIRKPASGIASQSNRGSIWGEHIDAHFSSVTQGPLHTHGDTSKGAWRCNERPLLMYPLGTSLLSFTYDSTRECYVSELTLDHSVEWKVDASEKPSNSLFPENCMFSKATINGFMNYGGGRFPFVINCDSCALSPGRDAYILVIMLNKGTYWSYVSHTRDTTYRPLIHTSAWCDLVVYGYNW